MADIDQIRLPDNSLYDIKDKTIRDEVKCKVYSSVEDVLGPNTIGSATIAGVFSAMPLCSVLFDIQSSFASDQCPSGFYGLVQIVKGPISFNRSFIEAHGSMASFGDWRMFLDADGNPTGIWFPISSGVVTGNVTAIASITTTSDNFYLKRIGGVVYFMLRFTVNASSSDFGICTLPTGFRPSARVVTSASRVWSRTGLSTQAETLAVTIASDGRVSANTASAGFSSSSTSEFFIQTSFPI